MSDSKPPSENVSSTTPPATTTATTEAVVTPKVKAKRPGYTNPAFKLMGIPTLRFPSRNWMIFWTVLGVFGGGALYDKIKQKQLRKQYMNLVAPMGEKSLPLNIIPRKLTIFIAPPPSDFLDSSLKVFRRYVKPILNSAAIDFEIVTESRQGEIRYKVAEDIRNLRRKYKGEIKSEIIPKDVVTPVDNDDEFVTPHSVYHWFDNHKSALNTKVVNEDGSIVTTKLSTTLSPLSLLGVNYKHYLTDDIPKVVSEDVMVEKPEEAGGVICIGRGAFKEYLTGVHEGLLGPLEPPVVVERIESEFEQEVKTLPLNGGKEEEEELKKEEVDGKKSTKNEDEQEKQTVPLPYINSTEYGKYELCSELDFSKQLLIDENKPAYFQQPILVLRGFGLSGFLKTPERIYRFYQKRQQLKFYQDKTMLVVDKKFRPFDSTKDVNCLVEEEDDWPHSWVKTGKEKGSLWTTELKCDDRVVRNLYVYDDDDE